MTEKEKEAIQMLKSGVSVAYVSWKTGLSSFWLSVIINREKI